MVDGERYCIRELHWNGISGRSFDLVRCSGDEVLTINESFDNQPTDAQIAVVLEEHGIEVELGTCKFCQGKILLATAHRHDNGWVGDRCCWDERLRMTA
ncbi:hypothetical protein AB0M05_40830 [Streptomyces violaceusniger]|uniref:hypothetical protein n=1 Tax=Streptomyces violaceusniger TaxID=68280 RepID=UPI00342EC7C4